MTNDPIKQKLTVPPTQMERITATGMKIVYGLDVTVHETVIVDHNMTRITFSMNERPTADGRYHDTDPLAQGEG